MSSLQEWLTNIGCEEAFEVMVSAGFDSLAFLRTCDEDEAKMLSHILTGLKPAKRARILKQVRLLRPGAHELGVSGLQSVRRSSSRPTGRSSGGLSKASTSFAQSTSDSIIDAPKDRIEAFFADLPRHHLTAHEVQLRGALLRYADGKPLSSELLADSLHHDGVARMVSAMLPAEVPLHIWVGRRLAVGLGQRKSSEVTYSQRSSAEATNGRAASKRDLARRVSEQRGGSGYSLRASLDEPPVAPRESYVPGAGDMRRSLDEPPDAPEEERPPSLGPEQSKDLVPSRQPSKGERPAARLAERAKSMNEPPSAPCEGSRAKSLIEPPSAPGEGERNPPTSAMPSAVAQVGAEIVVKASELPLELSSVLPDGLFATIHKYSPNGKKYNASILARGGGQEVETHIENGRLSIAGPWGEKFVLFEVTGTSSAPRGQVAGDSEEAKRTTGDILLSALTSGEMEKIVERAESSQRPSNVGSVGRTANGNQKPSDPENFDNEMRS